MFPTTTFNEGSTALIANSVFALALVKLPSPSYLTVTG